MRPSTTARARAWIAPTRLRTMPSVPIESGVAWAID
jgi:hypothetical protein